MRAFLATLGIILGVLLCVAGIAFALVTGFDARGTIVGLLLVCKGCGIAWGCRRWGGEERSSSEPERSSQRPPGDTKKNSRFSGKL